MRARGLRRTIVPALAALLALAPAAAAQTEAEQRAAMKVFRDYAPDGEIDPCKHTADELRKAAKTIPPDIEQYAADYPAAIRAAIEARARGECDKASATPTPTPAATTPPAATPGAGAPAPEAGADGNARVVPEPPAPETTPVATTSTVAPADALATRRASSGAPLPVVLLGVLAGLLALMALLAFLLRRAGVGEDRWAGAAHAVREAGWRASGTWADFRDWVRLGR